MTRLKKYTRILTLAFLAFCIAAPAGLFAQTTVVMDAPKVNGTTVVIPGKEFKRSGYHNFWWGKHYRTEWNTAARFPNFYIDTALGGLTPYAPGGGRQSKTLRLRTKSGGEYVLRSIHKDLGRAMPDATRGTVVNNIARDQSSMAHPYSAITITPMAEAAGVYHTVPRIVFLPVQAALGEYNADYGDQLYLFEQRPDENEQDAGNFGNSKNVIGTDRLFEKIYQDNDNHVDQVAYVRARLFDMFLSDWGRHIDNWRWGKFEEGKDNIYKPIPRDRDQAYTKLDGFYPSIAGMFYKPFNGFDDYIKNVPKWNRHARRLDMLFLTDLEKDEWIAQAKFLQSVLTDQLIESSIKLLPPEVFSISGEKIISKLKARRDHLEKFAVEYYDYHAKRVDIVGSQDKEFFCINRLPNNETEVCIYKITKEDKLRDKPFYSRVFKPGETKEIRIYSLESADKIEIRGENKGILVRLIDPAGEDNVTFVTEGLHPDLKEEQHYHSSKVRISAGRKYEYDTLHEKKLDISIRPVISSSHYKTFDNDPLKLFPRTGIKVLASITYKPQPWKKLDHERIHHLCANYGIFRGAFNVGYVGRLTRLFGKWDLMVRARIDAPAVENYFGTGNETKIENKDNNFYRTYSHRIYGSLGIERDFAKYHHAELFAFYQSVKVYRSVDHFTSEMTHLIDPNVFNRNQYAGAEAGYTYEKTNDRFAPTKGFGFTLGTGYFKNMDEKDQDFFKVLSSIYAYIPLGNRFSFATRVGGGAISGNAPYYYMNTLGGGGTGEIRGYDRERFYGKHSLHFNNDLRWIFPTRNFLFSGKAGLISFYDIGRVWVPGEKSNLWHNSYGGGILLVPYNKFAFSATYGASKEGGYIHFKAGLFF